ncbi:hypothetical protein B484DRAFT_333840, partial [Ochromonadaceae sp. CCMP2298]
PPTTLRLSPTITYNAAPITHNHLQRCANHPQSLSTMHQPPTITYNPAPTTHNHLPPCANHPQSLTTMHQPPTITYNPSIKTDNTSQTGGSRCKFTFYLTT